MNIRPIHNDDDLRSALTRLEELWGAAHGTPAHDELEVLSVLVEHYEDKHHATPLASPTELIRYKLNELGWSQNQLAHAVGWTSGRVSEVLSGKRTLTAAMVRQLAKILGINAGLLLGEERASEPLSVSVQIPAALAARLRNETEDENLEEAVTALVLRVLSQGQEPPRLRNRPTFKESNLAANDCPWALTSSGSGSPLVAA